MGTTDLKATVTAIITGIAWVILQFGFTVPEWITQGIIMLGVLILGYFINKPDKKKEPPTDTNKQ